MKSKKVMVEPYNPKWKTHFKQIKIGIESVLGNLALRVEHVGSTSVEGLSAKPIIDLDVVIRDYSVFNLVVDKLESVGYIYEGDLGIKDREAFKYVGEDPNDIDKYIAYKSSCIAKLYEKCGLPTC